MNEFRLVYPILLLLIPLGGYAFWRWHAPSASLRYSDIRLAENLPQNWRIKIYYIPDILRATAWILLVIALTRPQTGNAVEVIRGQGVDIVLVLDISTSMVTARDFLPNRLEVAKDVIQDFVSQREFDQIGLVLFAQHAYHQSPLTLDYTTLNRLIENVDSVRAVTDIRGNRLDGSAIGVGLGSAANMLRNSDAVSKVIILLTDGDNNRGADPLLVAEATSLFNIKIYTIGMGKTGVIRYEDITSDGDIKVIEGESNLNESLLRQIANIGNGLYFRAEDTVGLQQIYNQINRLERSDAERRLFVRWKDQLSFVLFPAMILLLIERILRLTVFHTIP